MIHPIPSGTRDVLPDEMRELRAITDALREVFERHGYGEVYTPAIEHESTLAAKDFVALERAVPSLGLGAEEADQLVRVPQLRGGPDVLAAPDGPVAAALSGLRGMLDLLEPAVAERVIFDLGLAHALGYYTGAVFEVYDAGLGQPLGGGGRYDDLIGRFGRELPACGWALNVERLHLARVGEGR